MFVFLYQPENIKFKEFWLQAKKKCFNPVVKVLGIIYSKLMINRPEDVQWTGHIQTKGAMIWGRVQTLAISLQICVKYLWGHVGVHWWASLYVRAHTHTPLQISVEIFCNAAKWTTFICFCYNKHRTSNNGPKLPLSNPKKVKKCN